MAIHEQIADYTVSTLRNDVVQYRRLLRLTTQAGTQAFVAFPPTPPPDWLQISGNSVTVYLPADDFDDTYQLLRSETPTYLTALALFGISAFSIDSGDQAPGQDERDPDELVAMMRTAAGG